MVQVEADGSITWISGNFERVRVPEELVYTWSVSIVPGDPTLVHVRFLRHEEGTELVLTHERFAVEAVATCMSWVGTAASISWSRS